MKYIIPFLIMFTSLAHADDFASRVKAGDEAAKTEQGKQYESSMGFLVGQAMLTCIPPGSKDTANLGKFIFVASVTETGVLSDIEVQPQSQISACFTKEFSKSNLPVPPEENNTGSGYPITITMSVTP